MHKHLWIPLVVVAGLIVVVIDEGFGVCWSYEHRIPR